MGSASGDRRRTVHVWEDVVDFKDLAGKAGELLGQHDDKVDEAIDKAAEAAKEKFAGHDAQIDAFAQKAKDHQFGAAEGAPGEPPAEPQGEPRPE
jgi:hypothetical protein